MTTTTTAHPLETRLDGHRAEIRAYCRRMLRSAFDADDAAQETLVRAWRNLDRFEGRSSLRSWLYSIATNVCVDLLRSRQRHPVPVDLMSTGLEPGPAAGSGPVAPPGRRPEGRSAPGPVQAVGGGGATVRPLGVLADPAELVVEREAVHTAVGLVVRMLPPRQRAVLILRDVLRWRADEVAELLDTSVPAVNSALQRARATLAGHDVSTADVAELVPGRPAPARVERHDRDEDATLVAGCVVALETDNVDSLVSLLRENVAAA